MNVECGSYVAVKLRPSKTSAFFHVFVAKISGITSLFAISFLEWTPFCSQLNNDDNMGLVLDLAYNFLYLQVYVDNDEVDLCYMKCCGDNVYVWPEEAHKELSQESLKESIVCTMSTPDLINAIEQYRFRDLHLLDSYIGSKFKMM
jgi:hypothetical protein